jgi:REP element-mobilizing transposase RayT
MRWLVTWSTYAAHPTTPHSEKLQSWRESLTRCPPCHLDAPRRRVILDTLISVCAEETWTLYALHVRTNHIHVILDAPDPAARIVYLLKSRATKALRSAGLVSASQPVWADYRNVRRLATERALYRAIHYVLNGQGVPLDRYEPWAARQQPNGSPK